MPWARLDDGFYDHPKTKAAGNEAVGLFARLLSYSTRFLLNGVVTEQEICEIAGTKRARTLIKQLVSAGLLDKKPGRSPRGTGPRYQIHDYLHYQDSAEMVNARRAAEREKKRKQREAQAHLSNGSSPGGTESEQLPESPGDTLGESRHPLRTAPRFQDLGVVDNEPESVTTVPAPTTDPTADRTPEDPKARAVALLERNGNTHDGAVELVDAIGPDAVLAKFSEAS